MGHWNTEILWSDAVYICAACPAHTVRTWAGAWRGANQGDLQPEAFPGLPTIRESSYSWFAIGRVCKSPPTPPILFVPTASRAEDVVTGGGLAHHLCVVIASPSSSGATKRHFHGCANFYACGGIRAQAWLRETLRVPLQCQNSAGAAVARSWKWHVCRLPNQVSRHLQAFQNRLGTVVPTIAANISHRGPSGGVCTHGSFPIGLISNWARFQLGSNHNCIPS